MPHACSVLLANVSSYERGLLVSHLRRRGFALDLLPVSDPREIDQKLRTRPDAGILIVDAGLLEGDADAQWSQLRDRHSTLCWIIRALIAEQESPIQTAERHYLIHPNDHDGLWQILSRHCVGGGLHTNATA